jgi:putative protease
MIKEMFVNDEKGDKASRGDSVTFPLDFRIRPSDKLYKIVVVEKELEKA